MVAGSELGQLCNIADTAEDFQKEIRQLASAKFDKFEIERRNLILSNLYSNFRNRDRVVRIIDN
jgi:hypothetical protein